MSELKAVHAFDVYEAYTKTGDDDAAQVYHKSEADKVIAELKADYKEACDRLQTANLIKDEQIAATRHQKYKRCLAMARWCKSMMIFNSKYGTDKKWHLFNKWRKRCLALAAEPTWAKFLQLIHKESK